MATIDAESAKRIKNLVWEYLMTSPMWQWREEQVKSQNAKGKRQNSKVLEKSALTFAF
jgi:hypothetical protein